LGSGLGRGKGSVPGQEAPVARQLALSGKRAQQGGTDGRWSVQAVGRQAVVQLAQVGAGGAAQPQHLRGRADDVVLIEIEREDLEAAARLVEGRRLQHLCFGGCELLANRGGSCRIALKNACNIALSARRRIHGSHGRFVSLERRGKVWCKHVAQLSTAPATFERLGVVELGLDFRRQDASIVFLRPVALLCHRVFTVAQERAARTAL
jgi:hypothetical protein